MCLNWEPMQNGWLLSSVANGIFREGWFGKKTLLSLTERISCFRIKKKKTRCSPHTMPNIECLELSRREDCWKSNGSNEKMAMEKVICQSAFIKKLSTPLAGNGYSALTLHSRKTNEQYTFYQHFTTWKNCF